MGGSSNWTKLLFEATTTERTITYYESNRSGLLAKMKIREERRSTGFSTAGRGYKNIPLVPH